jgi:hypothetical protein
MTTMYLHGNLQSKSQPRMDNEGVMSLSETLRCSASVAGMKSKLSSRFLAAVISALTAQILPRTPEHVKRKKKFFSPRVHNRAGVQRDDRMCYASYRTSDRSEFPVEQDDCIRFRDSDSVSFHFACGL